MAYVAKGANKPKMLCCCCGCCCNTLGPIIQKGTFDLMLTSRLVAEDDHDKCIACGVCVDSCIFRTRKLLDGELAYGPSHCMSYGVCVSTCPHRHDIDGAPQNQANKVTPARAILILRRCPPAILDKTVN